MIFSVVLPAYSIRNVKKFLWDHPEIIHLAGRKKEIIDSLLRLSRKGIVDSQEIIETFSPKHAAQFFQECAKSNDHQAFFYFDVIMGLGDHWLILYKDGAKTMAFPFKLEFKK